MINLYLKEYDQDRMIFLASFPNSATLSLFHLHFINYCTEMGGDLIEVYSGHHVYLSNDKDIKYSDIKEA